jgi:hypothetical protein
MIPEMNSDERALARILFMNKILSSSGQEFENLFTRIMQYANANFIQIKPQGKIGDRKNDGYDPTKGTYYQVFSPEEPTASEAAAVKKVSTDFAGLLKYWDTICPVKEFRFVFNDKYNGSFPTIEQDLLNIKKTHGLQGSGVFLARDLEDVFFTLKSDQMKAIVGFLPDPARVQLLDFSILGQVIAQVLRYKTQLGVTQILSAPDLDEKIKFNGLGPQVSVMLKHGSFHAGTVENYFSLNSTFTKQDVRNRLNDLYRSRCSANKTPLPAGVCRADVIFFEVLREISPASGSGEAQDAALILLAYFFEACDVFEDPNSVTL